MPIRTTLIAAMSALALSACASTPVRVTSNIPASENAGAFLSAEDGVATPNPLPEKWWRLYRDPVLDTLVADALATNTDIRQAVARVDRARAALRGARADELPQTSLGGSAGYARSAQDQVPSTSNHSDASFSIGANVAYEIDLFGRIKSSVLAAKGDAAAARADADAVRVIVAADTTRAYADAASSAARIDVARSILALLDETLRLTRQRHDAGLSDGLAVARIETLREQRAATIPAIEAQRSAALFALATLTGRPPSALPNISGERVVPLEIAVPLPVGDGGQLLARRPDVRAAEARLRADTARIDVAEADLYPRITLGGSLSSTANSVGNLFTGGPLGFFLGSLIDWAFPNNEPVRAQIDAAGADAAQSLAAFDGAVLTALQETETALSSYARALEQRRLLGAARSAAQRAAMIVRAQNREGLVNSLETLDAERTLAEAEAALADQDALVSRSQIEVFRALGGGWSEPHEVAAR